MYKRKTTDEYDIMADYGQGWELVNCETTRKDARRSVKEYRENESYPCKIVKRRVKICTHNEMTWKGNKWICSLCGYSCERYRESMRLRSQ